MPIAWKCDLASSLLLTFSKQHETSLCTIKQWQFHPRGGSTSGVSAVFSEICLSHLTLNCRVVGSSLEGKCEVTL